MEIKTAFSSQFNHDAAIKGSGLLGMFFLFLIFLSQVLSTKSKKKKQKTQKWHFEVVVVFCFLHLLQILLQQIMKVQLNL